MSFFKGIKNLFAVTEDPTARDIEKVRNLAMDIIIFSENDKDTNEKKQYKHWAEMIKKHCRLAEEHNITAHLLMYKQAGHCEESWAEYEQRLDIESKKITVDRIKYWQVKDPDFYDDFIRPFAKETDFGVKKKKTTNVKEETDKAEYVKNVRLAA